MKHPPGTPFPARSQFGERISGSSGILELMKDLGEALTENRDAIMMGGGNPARIPAMEALWRDSMSALLAQPEAFGEVLAHYDPPAGNPAFLDELAGFLRRQCGWNVTRKNLAITVGGQTAFFFLLNLFGGKNADGSLRKVLLPIMPEYIGYASQGVAPGLFHAIPPKIAFTGQHRFKYQLDLAAAEAVSPIGAICVSRPSNPSANVLTDDEVRALAALARKRGVPLILDNAYGLPFPGVIFTGATPYWDENTIVTLSLSKLGLPGTRTGIVVAHEDIIQDIAAMTAVTGLANTNLGQALVRPLLRGDRLAEVCETVIRPFYRDRCEAAIAELEARFSGLPYRLHEPEGAFFLWLWIPGLPVTSRELYRRLKAKGLVVVPGEYFFYALEQEDRHHHECVRITYTQPFDRIRRGIDILASELRELTSTGG